MSTITSLINTFVDPKKHLCILYNDHWSCYDTIEHFYYNDQYGLKPKPEQWVDYEASIQRNSVWDVRLFDKNEIVYHRLASTLSAALGGPDDGGTCMIGNLIMAIVGDRPNSFYIDFNEHAPEIYENAEYDPYADHECWAGGENDHLEALMTNHVWAVQYYPTTPVGFWCQYSSTLEKALNVI